MESGDARLGRILLTPGPCMTSPTVRQAASVEDMNHREPAFQALMAEVRAGLSRLVPGAWRPYLLGGSGTAAVEAMVTSTVRTGPVLVLENGYYSGRIAEILAVHGIPHRRLALGWLEPMEGALDRFETALAETSFEAVLLTHHETTTGTLNPVAAVAELAARHGARCLVDAMSSFGADPLPFNGVAAFAASANKCLHALPGVSFVFVRGEFDLADVPRRSYYLHLPMYGGESPPLTPPVPALAALRQALRERPSDRPERYLRQVTRLREALGGLGLEIPVPASRASRTLVMASLPKGWRYDAWFDAHLARGFVIYGCKGELRERYFQVSVMGEVTDAHLDQWLEATAELIDRGPETSEAENPQ